MEKKRFIITIVAVLAIIGFFVFTKTVTQEQVEELGLTVPLPLFTAIIGLLDGFNPCTIWLLTFLLVLLISVSHSRARILAVGYSFVVVVFIIYFVFMAAWLNLFRFLGFIDVLALIIGIVAVIAGLLNCKDYIFARKDICVGGVCEVKKPEEESIIKRVIFKRIDRILEVIKKGSFPTLILTSVVLAVFSSMVEIPCTFGFPLIYTKILAEKVFENSLTYYLYLALYNIIYVMPLMFIITVFGYSFRGKEISKETMQKIKFIGGLMMIVLGIILIVNPSLLALAH